LYGVAILVPREGHKYGCREVTETSVVSFAVETQPYYITLEFRQVEINISSSARIIQLTKTKAITHFFFDPRDSLLGQP